MFDYQEARLWADHHTVLAGWARRMTAEIGESFRVLSRLQYEQPWRHVGPARARIRH